MLSGAAEHVGDAYRQADLARARIADAVAVLDGLGRRSESLVPVELRHAAEELERGLGLISGTAAVLREAVLEERGDTIATLDETASPAEERGRRPPQ
ncbi:hypothetical protein [Pseudonocardia kunmingensis]|uniref:hypothetical protein n=1 Tax=Pseudonocardia kunmingensis TaxID=630975 RepID=UPI001153E6BC|nr:hypothetical protein [Pseudonocardia kunmingensis]